jgi:hypothetical protein
MPVESERIARKPGPGKQVTEHAIPAQRWDADGDRYCSILKDALANIDRPADAANFR